MLLRSCLYLIQKVIHLRRDPHQLLVYFAKKWSLKDEYGDFEVGTGNLFQYLCFLLHVIFMTFSVSVCSQCLALVRFGICWYLGS